MSIRIVNAALSKDGDKQVLRGELDFSTSNNLKYADYQREALPQSSLKSIIECHEKGGVLPSINLSMRGTRFKQRDGAFILDDDVYVVDGLQRVTGSNLFLVNNPGKIIRLGVEVIFPQTEDEERERFEKLNVKRLKVSSDKLLYNRRVTSRGIQQLYALTNNDKSFPLYNRVTWSQNRSRGEYTGGMTFAKVVGHLHYHRMNGLSSSLDGVIQHVDKIADDVGIMVMRQNIHTFYTLIDECWHIRSVVHHKRAPQLRAGFQFMLARYLSDHSVFWQGTDEKRLFISVDLRRKMGQFSLLEPLHENLTRSTGGALLQLYIFLDQHMNKGKRTQRLRPRVGKTMISTFNSDPVDKDDSSEAQAAE